MAVDWRQTHWMSQHHIVESQGKWYGENNPLLGEFPSSRTVAIYFGGTLALSTALYAVLPKWSRPFVFGAITSLELTIVINNHRAGTQIWY